MGGGGVGGRNARDADAAGALHRGPSLISRIGVRLDVVRHLHRRERVHVDRDLAANVDTCEVVPSRIGDRQAIADEHHRRFLRSIQLAARIE